MRKILSVFVMTMSLILSSSTFVFASTPTPTSSSLEKTTFSKDTVITEENLNAVLESFGIDPSTVLKDNNLTNTSEVVTVGDLDAVLNTAKQTNSNVAKKSPKINPISSISTSDNSKTGTITPLSSVGTATAVYTAVLGDLTTTDNVSGTYYMNGEERWWTSAGTASVTVSSSSGFYTWNITSVRTLRNVLYNGSTPSSYLSFTFDFTATQYVKVVNVLVPTGLAQNVSGTHNFDASYI